MSTPLFRDYREMGNGGGNGDDECSDRLFAEGLIK
jgi:hypothetical protein